MNTVHRVRTAQCITPSIAELTRGTSYGPDFNQGYLPFRFTSSPSRRHVGEKFFEIGWAVHGDGAYRGSSTKSTVAFGRSEAHAA